ncbi:uracil-DNA glycosylase family protein [Yunchengibacter salinarum]|uniref:uracil-DNA glycosylase family protein n=1 Tax=Yunchengibacter salinarum TaxID=3133399 RepID=UPI0035B5EDBE
MPQPRRPAEPARSLASLAAEVRACTHCAADLPLGPRPVIQVGSRARILVAGQAPGTRVHASGLPFDDPSGDLLRHWMGIDRKVFYDPGRINIIPMGFCYPGRGGGGDLPPHPACRALWHDRLMATLPKQALILAIGAYAQAYHLGPARGRTLADTVQNWRSHLANGILPMPHPSPRNRLWLKRNRFFEEEVVPVLQQKVASVLYPSP